MANLNLDLDCGKLRWKFEICVWKEWENATASFYEEMKAILPDCPMINKLLKSVKYELAHIH